MGVRERIEQGRTHLNLPLSYFALCVVALATSTTTATAGTVEQAMIIAEPQMQVKDGAIQGCGYRLKSFPQSWRGLNSVVALDTSFNIYSNGLALLKGGAVRFPVNAGALGQAANKPIVSFWMKAQAEKPTKALNGKVLAAETQGYLIYGEDFAAVGKLFESVGDGTPLTIGVRVKGEGIDRIYSGVAQLTDQDQAQTVQCMDELIKQLEAEKESKPSGK